MKTLRVLGIAGWSGSGKTRLISRLLPAFGAASLRVATLKHAHHSFDVDIPGKDSYEHRKAGAGEVIVSSARRWVQMHEVGAQGEATLAQLLRRVSPCDLVLVEGYKSEPHPKLEVYRRALGTPALYLEDKAVIGVASDQPLPDAPLPVVDLNDTAQVASFILEHAVPLEQLLLRLEAPRAGP